MSLDLDGLSDLSIVLTDFLNTTINIVYNRVKSIVNYKLKDKLEPLINKILDSIPNTFTIPGTDIEAMFYLNQNMVIKENDYMQLPLDIEVDSAQYPYPYINNDTLPVYEESDY